MLSSVRGLFAKTLPACSHVPKPYEGPSAEEIQAKREQFLYPGLVLYYKSPIAIVEGKQQYLWDESGKRYLDCIGGICTITAGHCHPYTTAALREQAELIHHTSPIYLHPEVSLYAEELVSKMPAGSDLSSVYFVNSGSEANDLAVAMSRAYTGNWEIISVSNGYHGGSHIPMGLTSLNTWKQPIPHGFGILHAMCPDGFRGPFSYDDPDMSSKYAAEVKNLITHSTPGKVAAWIAETIQGVGGIVQMPDGYLGQVYDSVRSAGGLCIADEVQTGFGRTGTHYWGFETQGVVPDIVTFAKGIGNGVPLAAVVTRPEIAKAFATKLHFNTFGGNPLCSAVGRATLRAIDDDNLQENALNVGTHLLQRLEGLKEEHEIVADVRGQGLMVGVEFCKDRISKEPAVEEVAHIFEHMKENNVLAGKGGIAGTVIRILPPMCMTIEDADYVADVIDDAIRSL